MPITWTHENVSRLFLITLAVHHIHMDYKQIAAAFGGDASPRAIEEKMKKLRKEAREFSDGSATTFPVSRRGRGGAGTSRSNGGKCGSTRGRGRGCGARGGKGGMYKDSERDVKHEGEEDDSENESMIDPALYGDLMQGYLMKKERQSEESSIKLEVDGGMFDGQHQYYENAQEQQLENVIDPALQDAIGFANYDGLNGANNMMNEIQSENHMCVHSPEDLDMQFQSLPQGSLVQHDDVTAFELAQHLEEALREPPPMMTDGFQYSYFSATPVHVDSRSDAQF